MPVFDCNRDSIIQFTQSLRGGSSFISPSGFKREFLAKACNRRVLDIIQAVRR
jgi:hypothetical protein